MIALTSYQTTIILPNPEWSDSEELTGEVTIKRSVDGQVFSYIKSKEDRRRLIFRIRLTRSKSLELKAFIQSYYSSKVRLIDHEGQKWVGSLSSNPFEFEALFGEEQDIQLEFEGIKQDTGDLDLPPPPSPEVYERTCSSNISFTHSNYSEYISIYTWPESINADMFLKTDGAGNLSWRNPLLGHTQHEDHDLNFTQNVSAVKVFERSLANDLYFNQDTYGHTPFSILEGERTHTVVRSIGGFIKTGWPRVPNVSLSIDDGTMTITVTDDSNAYYYINGVEYILGGNKTVVLDGTAGLWYIYFSGDTLTKSQTPWVIGDDDKAMVSILHWDDEDNRSIILGYEFHGYTMDAETHEVMHETSGAQWMEGLLVASAGEQIEVSAGGLHDEDLHIDIIDGDGGGLFEQVLSPAQLPILYRDGASGWRVYNTNEKANATDVGYTNGGNLKYNKLNGVWANWNVSGANYVAYWIVASNCVHHPVMAIMGQREDNTIAQAKENNIFASLDLTGLPTEEMIVLARCIIKEVAGGIFYTLEEILDLRITNLTGNVTSPLIVDHGALAGLADDDHVHYLLADGSRELTGNMSVDNAITIDGRDISVDGGELDNTKNRVKVDVDATTGYLGAAAGDGVLRAGTGISYVDGGDFVTLDLDINSLTGEAAIVAADTLAFYDDGIGNRKITLAQLSTALGASDEKVKVDVGAVAGYLGVAAGDGVLRTDASIAWADGGNFVTLSLNINGLDVDTIAADDTLVFYDDGGVDHNKITFANFEGTLSHDALADYDANDHIDHTTITLTAGEGLTGGGTIADNRTFDLDFPGLAADTIAAADLLAFFDDGDVHNKITFANFEGTLSHDALADYAANKHVVLPNTIANVLTDHNLAAHTALKLIQVIDSNTTIYLDTGGDDGTGDGSSGDPWKTLDKALDYLSDKLIAASATVTIEFGDGTHTRVATDTINHINGDRIKITGKNTYDLGMTGVVGAPGGGAGAWSIVVQVGANEADEAVNGDYLFIPYNVTGGTFWYTLPGCWLITNVDKVNHRLTITNTSAYGTAPSGLITGTVTLMKTILFYDGVSGLTIDPNRNLGELTKIVLVGDGTSNGISMGRGSIVNCTSPVGINNFNNGVVVTDAAFLSFRTCTACNCTTAGLYLYYGAADAVYGAYVGNTYGLRALHGTVDVYLSTLSGNSNIGLSGERNSTLDSLSAKIVCNTTFGTYAYSNTYIRVTGSIWANNGTDSSPVVNNLGNIESYIEN